jgi:hypothetical protein
MSQVDTQHTQCQPWQLLKVVMYAGAKGNLLWANVQLDRSVGAK